MQFTISDIAKLLNGKVTGNETAVVTQLAKIEDATSGSLSFLANPKYEEYLYTTQASAVLVNADYVPEKPVNVTLIQVANAYAAFSVMLDKFQQAKMPAKTIEPNSYVHPSAKIGSNCYIGAFAYIGENAVIGDDSYVFPSSFVGANVSTGKNCIIYAGVKVYADTVLGDNVIIHSGCVIGADGFGFAPMPDGSYHKIPQIGNVVLEDNVEIGANTTIDCATMGSTIIHQGVKLDNLIQIAHNVEIGKNTVIASQAGVSGSTKVGENCIIGGQVGIVGHVNIAKGSMINAKSGISKSIKDENQKWNGAPATNFNDSLRAQAVIRRLPELERKIMEIEALLAELKQQV